MRISDWSSDVCSSDLPLRTVVDRRHPRPLGQLVLLAIVAVLQLPARVVADLRECGEVVEEGAVVDHRGVAAVEREAVRTRRVAELQVHCRAGCQRRVEPVDAIDRKSTPSELQSLMRISYAVFCLKTKKIK